MSVAGYLYGKPCCSCILAWWPSFEALVGRSIPIIQAIGNAPASAGFHEGGGSVDCAPLATDELRMARNCGAAAWYRPWAGNYHTHMRLNGCPHNTVAQPQIDDLNEGRDGTGPLYDNAGVPDNGPRDGVHWPLRTWREGIDWAEEMDMTPEQAKKLDGIATAVASLADMVEALADGNEAIKRRITKSKREVIAAIEDGQ